jgi:hypothetical protein
MNSFMWIAERLRKTQLGLCVWNFCLESSKKLTEVVEHFETSLFKLDFNQSLVA